MRYVILFLVTLLLSLIIIFYPQKYLMKFENQITVNYSEISDEALWTYELSNNNLKLKEEGNNIWTFIPNNNGKTVLTFYYDKKDNDYRYKIIYNLEVNKNKIIWLSGEAIGLMDYPNLY